MHWSRFLETAADDNYDTKVKEEVRKKKKLL